MKQKSYAVVLPCLAGLLVAVPLAAQIAPSQGPFIVEGNLAGVSLRPVVGGLANPVAVTHTGMAGDARLFVTLQDGRVVIVDNGQVRAQPFLDVRDRVLSGGERGLLSIAFHPDYADNGFFYANYTDSGSGGDTVISRFAVTNDPNRADPGSERKLLGIDQPFSNHNGGQLQFGPDGYLYVGMGDGGAGNDPNCFAQKGDELLGKLLRLDVDQSTNAAPFHGIPLDNPFRGPGNPRDEIWASGLRNPWRFSFDRLTGDLWIGDVGQGAREEIDFQPAGSLGGENYGWKTMEGTLCQSRDACPASTPACNASAYTPPVLEYAHPTGCSVTGGYVYRGARFPQLRGTYLFGDLCSGIVYAAARQGGNLGVRRLAQTAEFLTAFGEDKDGELYLVTLGGTLFALEGPSPAPSGSDEVGLFEPPGSRFHLKAANTAAAAIKSFRFGAKNSGWLPIAGDWNGDGKDTIGFWDPQARTFRLKNALKGGASDVVLAVSPPAADMLPVAGDWNGDGRDTVGLYDPATARFYLKDTLSGSGFDVQRTFGASSELLPVAGDWDGDGRDGVGVFNPTTSFFQLTNSLVDGQPIHFTFGFAFPHDNRRQPVAGDWNGDGIDTVGTYETATRTFRLTNQQAGTTPQITFRFGQRRAGWLPLAGDWGL
jgi:glucose/arabinose dehydrogenase